MPKLPRRAAFLFIGSFLLVHFAWNRAMAQEASQYDIEAHLRQELKKLRQWSVDKLLKTEQAVDLEQKKRANYSTNPEELTLLADDEDSEVRFYVAANPHTPLGVKMRLARDPVTFVRGGVALTLKSDPLDSPNAKRVTEMIALHLAQDSQPIIRMALARNRVLPVAVYDVLARDSDYIVRHKLATNLFISHGTIETLVQDSVAVVQIQALQHRNLGLSWLEKMSDHLSPQIRLAICQNINAPVHILDRMAQDSDPTVRRASAIHGNIADSTLKKMLGDDDPEVLLAVAGHAKADRAMLMQIAYNVSDPNVRMLAIRRLEPFLREEIQDDILERWKAE